MPHLGARSGTSCLHGLNQEVHSFTLVKDVFLMLLSFAQLSPGSPQPTQCAAEWLREGFTHCPAPANCAMEGFWLEEPTSFPAESPHSIPCPNHLSKQYSIPGRRSHPATFQDTVFLSSQSKGPGKIDELLCNKYFPLQSSPGQRGYRPTRIETEIVNDFPRVHVLGESVQIMKVDVEHKVT